MRRRELLTGLVGALAASTVRARAAGKTYRLAVMGGSQPTSEMSETGFYGTLFKELRRLGYIEGENLIVLRFSAEGDPARYDSIIGEVISAAPDVVITGNNPLVLRFKALTKSTPIVALMGDPVAWGIVRSLAHPGRSLSLKIALSTGLRIWGSEVRILSGAPNRSPDQSLMSKKMIDVACRNLVSVECPQSSGTSEAPRRPPTPRGVCSVARCMISKDTAIVGIATGIARDHTLA
jgi:ABC transporter substrate binding protein